MVFVSNNNLFAAFFVFGVVTCVYFPFLSISIFFWCFYIDCWVI